MRRIKSFFAAFAALIMICASSVTALAYDYNDLPEGTYQVKAELSCYVNAMGGVEFGAPLLTSTSVEVAANGTKMLTLYFTKSQVTIYSITCDTFIDFSPSYVTETNGIKSGTLGYYSADGTLITDTVEYTLSDDTAENAQKEQVHYVDSISFPVEYESDTYSLTLFINSNVMGTQFTKDGYPATLSVDWASASADGVADTKNPPESEATDEAEGSSSVANVESKDGLNIYHADEADNSESGSAEAAAVGYYVAYFREPVLIAVAAIAGIMIIGGIVLIMLDRRREKRG